MKIIILAMIIYGSSSCEGAADFHDSDLAAMHTAVEAYRPGLAIFWAPIVQGAVAIFFVRKLMLDSIRRKYYGEYDEILETDV